MKYIALTQTNGESVFYNLDHIVSFWPQDDRTRIETVIDGNDFVSESIAVVLAKIDEIS